MLDPISIPTTSADATTDGIDLDGDGHVDNAYGQIVVAFDNGAGLDSGAMIEAAIANGMDLELLRLSATDPALADDACAAITLERAETSPPPKFDGTDAFTVDGAFAPTPMPGAIAAGTYTSMPSMPGTTTPLAADVVLPLAGVLVPMHLVDVHVTFDASTGALSNGKIDGAIRASDIPSFYPYLADAMNQSVQMGSSSGQQILAEFDTGGPDCLASDAKDGIVETCEIEDSSFIQALFAPDVQLFAADGVTFQPTPHGTPDSLSVGYGFSAVPASF